MAEARDPIRLLVPDLPPSAALLPYLAQIDALRHYTNFGPLSRRLEERLAELAGARHAVCLASGTAGLELALAALGLPAGARVALPALTFAATGTAIRRAGLEPLFCDIDPASGLLAPDTVAAAAAAAATSPAPVAAVMPVSLFGRSQDCAGWEAFSRRTGLPVVLDAAGAIGHQRLGPASTAVFSLHATKPLAAGEGGFLATADGALAERVRALANFGFAAGAVREAGTNAKLSEYHAAVGLAALDAWPGQQERRLALFERYRRALAREGADGCASILNLSGGSGMLVVRLRRALAAADLARFAAAGIEVRRWYWPPLHRHPAFAACPRAGALDATEALAARLLGLPYHLFLSDADLGRIARALAEGFA